MFNIAEVSDHWAKQETLSSSLLESIDSTNNYAKKNLPSLNKFPHLIFAQKQTNGRGRGSNKWVMPGDGESLACSFIFQLKQPPQPIATPCFGWAVHRALSESFDLNFSVKAPNDIYIDNSKIGGILLESVSQGEQHHLILGLGLNIFSHPNIEGSKALAEFTQKEIEENQWEQFLSHLVSLSSQAAIASEDSTLSGVIISELDDALKKYSQNQIDSLLPDGGLQLKDGNVTNWRDL